MMESTYPSMLVTIQDVRTLRRVWYPGLHSDTDLADSLKAIWTKLKALSLTEFNILTTIYRLNFPNKSALT